MKNQGINSTSEIDKSSDCTKTPATWDGAIPFIKTPIIPGTIKVHAVPPDRKNVSIIDMKQAGAKKRRDRLHLKLCHGNHDAAMLYTELIDLFTSTKKGKALIENRRDGFYWWSHAVKKWAAKFEWSVPHTEYIMKRLRAFGLIATRIGKTPVNMQMIRPLVAEGAALLNGVPDESNYVDLLKPETLTQQASQTEKCRNASRQNLPECSPSKSAETRIKDVQVSGEQVKDIQPVSKETDKPATPAAFAGASALTPTPAGKANPKLEKGDKGLTAVLTPIPKGKLRVAYIWETMTGQKLTPKQAVQLKNWMLMYRTLPNGFVDPLPMLEWALTNWYAVVRNLYGDKPIPLDFHRPHVGLFVQCENEISGMVYHALSTAAERAEHRARCRAEREAERAAQIEHQHAAELADVAIH